jgi:TonB family protein
MSYAGFASHLDASPSRSSRLMFASVIACSSLAIAAAFALTLERMSIFRVQGPKTTFELAAVVIAAPPPVADPPPKPEEIAAASSDQGGMSTPSREESKADSLIETSEPSIRDDSIGSADNHKPGIPGIPSGGASCPGGICGKGPIGNGIGGTGSCIGPNCKKSSAKPPPPKPLPLSSLACITCPDPSTTALRRTAAGMRKDAGTNTTRFCVDTSGHVEPGSVATQTSHGDPAIDRLCRDTVKTWRFSPTKVDGQARRACSEATFRIEFE